MHSDPSVSHINFLWDALSHASIPFFISELDIHNLIPCKFNLPLSPHSHFSFRCSLIKKVIFCITSCRFSNVHETHKSCILHFYPSANLYWYVLWLLKSYFYFSASLPKIIRKKGKINLKTSYLLFWLVVDKTGVLTMLGNRNKRSMAWRKHWIS